MLRISCDDWPEGLKMKEALTAFEPYDTHLRSFNKKCFFNAGLSGLLTAAECLQRHGLQPVAFVSHPVHTSKGVGFSWPLLTFAAPRGPLA